MPWLLPCPPNPGLTYERYPTSDAYRLNGARNLGSDYARRHSLKPPRLLKDVQVLQPRNFQKRIVVSI